jgi:hypothetical protein
MDTNWNWCRLRDRFVALVGATSKREIVYTVDHITKWGGDRCQRGVFAPKLLAWRIVFAEDGSEMAFDFAQRGWREDRWQTGLGMRRSTDSINPVYTSNDIVKFNGCKKS